MNHNQSTTSQVIRLERYLLLLAFSFVIIFAAGLSLSPIVRSRSTATGLRWGHWLGVLAFICVFYLNHREYSRRQLNRDPYLMPIAAMLTGWGLLTIWRLFPYFGFRQTIWLVIGGTVLFIGARLSNDLNLLRRYKYIWLTGGLLFTGLTLILGTNPLGTGPRMWLGCCGIYFQPSEPLKLLLIIYLSAYLAGLYPFALRRGQPPIEKDLDSSQHAPLLSLLAPTLILTGLAMAILIAQRDLGTASVFLFIYTTIVYFTTARFRVVFAGVIGIILAGLVGYWLFDVVRLRFDAWFNPWIDPTGRSFQIVQSILAIANGGLVGRGPGMGNPALVPIPHSDFIFSAISEETGLVGSIALLSILAILAWRGLRAAFTASDIFKRNLATGITAYLVGQSVLIIGGNIRLLPLTGVTLPFVSYGGSSLLISLISLLLLLHISSRNDESPPTYIPLQRPYFHLSTFLFIGICAAGLAAGWWSFYRGPDLLTRTDNARRAIDERFVRRGSILDRSNRPLAQTIGEPGEYTRDIPYAPLSVVIGYTHPVFGQSGLESGVDGYLRGQQGIPGLSLWWHHLLYGQPPPGLDIRTTLNFELQRIVDETISGIPSSAVLMNPDSGEILAMASHPGFDANTLDSDWEILIDDPDAPLLNRALQGVFPAGQWIDRLPRDIDISLGLESTAYLRLPAAQTGFAVNPQEMINPMQAVLMAAQVSNDGLRPAPQLVQAVLTPSAGWVLLPPLSEPEQGIPSETALRIADDLETASGDTWDFVFPEPNSQDSYVTWYIGGTHPSWSGSGFVLALVIEQNDPDFTRQAGRKILQEAMLP